MGEPTRSHPTGRTAEDLAAVQAAYATGDLPTEITLTDGSQET